MKLSFRQIAFRVAGILWLPSLVILVSIIYSRLNSDIGYKPLQPVEFSHKVHSGDYQIKCLFCHHEAEDKSFSAVPTTFSCMVCHVALKAESEKMKSVIGSYDDENPIKWTRIYKLPEYTQFNHNAHIMSNIDCSSCHGEIEKMEQVYKVRDMSMSWCIDCHRNPEHYIIEGREISGIFVTDYSGENAGNKSGTRKESEFGSFLSSRNFSRYNIISSKKAEQGPENCSACHH